MTPTTNENSCYHVPSGLLFVQSFGQSCALRVGSNSERVTCTRRPRHGELQTNIRSRSFLGGPSEKGMVRKCHKCVSGRSNSRRLNSGIGGGTERRITITMNEDERRSEEGDVNRFEREEENSWQMNKVAGEKESELRDAFSSSRAEWGDEGSRETPKSDMSTESYKGWQQSDVAASSYAEWRESEIVDETFPDRNKREQSMGETVSNEKRKRKEKEDETLTVVSGRDLMKKFIGVPGYLLRELIVPISEVGSVLWYDTKMSVIDALKGERRYFVEDVTDHDAYHNETEENVVDIDVDEEQLSVEERQILEVQESAVRAANKIQSTMTRLFGRLF